MGLFDKKKKGRDDFDSPVEHVDLNASGSAVTRDDEAGTDPDEAETVDFASASPAARAGGAATRPAEPQRRRQRTSPGTYGIDDAIALMRTLPSENVELVVQVVKQTLESARIDIGVIIEDATAKQQRIESRIKVLRDAIGELEREIDTRRAEIDQLETDNRETTRVRERLVLAEKLAQGVRPEARTEARTEARPDTVVESFGAGGARGREAPPSAAPRHRSASSPPPTPAAGGGNPNHVGSGNHVVPGPVGPGGPVVGSSAVGPGGPAGSYAHKATSSHTVISKK